MAEKTAQSTPIAEKIPSETREHMRAAGEALRDTFNAMFPPEVTAHGRKARKEMLLAWRSLIDAALNRIDEHEKGST